MGMWLLCLEVSGRVHELPAAILCARFIHSFIHYTRSNPKIVCTIGQVHRDQLALLEFVLKSCQREDPALMGRRWVLPLNILILINWSF